MTEQLSDTDIDRIAAALAPKLIDGVKANHHDFWIDPETHYQDHLTWRQIRPDEVHSIKELVRLFVTTKGLFWKAFLGAAVLGAIVLTAIGQGYKG